MPKPGSERGLADAPPSPALVAAAGWLLPGAGYWLIGERARGITVGVAVIALFVMGLLIGGVRVIQVPGYGENGGRLFVERVAEKRGNDTFIVARFKEQSADRLSPPGKWVATDPGALLRDVGNKPWSICQVLAGPVGIAGGAWSVSASRPVQSSDASQPAGVLSHSRINEIAVLYTAVAGMLNLLVIIDAASRAARGEVPRRSSDAAGGASHPSSAKSSLTLSVEAA